MISSRHSQMVTTLYGCPVCQLLQYAAARARLARQMGLVEGTGEEAAGPDLGDSAYFDAQESTTESVSRHTLVHIWHSVILDYDGSRLSRVVVVL